MKPKLTVITPVYNIAEYLPRFFECFKAQTFRDYQLLVLDDGSADNSLEVCRKYAAEDDRIRVIASEHLGVTRIRNYSLQFIDTPLVAWADGDDIIDPDYLKHLVDAIEKYDADLSISRVEYLRESDLQQTTIIPEREETFAEGDALRDLLPDMLWERRLNYFYAKMFRSSLLKTIRAEEDVEQGSDTMCMIQYIHKAKSVVLINDVDYHYVKYGKRSVTSYFGEKAFARLLRINLFVRECCRENNTLTERMEHTIDGRIFLSGIWITEKIMAADMSEEERIKQLSGVLDNEEYRAAYQRQKDKLDYDFEPIPPQSGEKYYRDEMRRKRKMQRRGKILSHSPAFFVKHYQNLKYRKNGED